MPSRSFDKEFEFLCTDIISPCESVAGELAVSSRLILGAAREVIGIETAGVSAIGRGVEEDDEDERRAKAVRTTPASTSLDK